MGDFNGFNRVVVSACRDAFLDPADLINEVFPVFIAELNGVPPHPEQRFVVLARTSFLFTGPFVKLCFGNHKLFFVFVKSKLFTFIVGWQFDL